MRAIRENKILDAADLLFLYLHLLPPRSAERGTT
jgi:hypothetical protein